MNQLALNEDLLTELVGLGLNHGCRTEAEQRAMLVAAGKIDRRHGINDGMRGLVREVIDTYAPCGGKCLTAAEEDRVRDLNEECLRG